MNIILLYSTNNVVRPSCVATYPMANTQSQLKNNFKFYSVFLEQKKNVSEVEKFII